VHVPYKGTPEALTDTMTGRIAYYFSPISAALPLVRDGKLLALAVSSARRSSVLPNVPTVAESGLPGFDYNLWSACLLPRARAEVIEDQPRRQSRAERSRRARAFSIARCRGVPMSTPS
jgi:tripartite-type tricarboxylate transporter receptor subunit TctC